MVVAKEPNVGIHIIRIILNLKVKERSFKRKTRSIHFSTPSHAETRNCGFVENMWFWRPFFCFANLKVKDTEYRTLSDGFEFSTPKLCQNKWLTNHILILPSNVQCFRFQPSLNTDNFITGRYILTLKKYINIYKSKYHWVLNKYISGVRKHRPHGDMGNNCVLFSRFH